MSFFISVVVRRDEMMRALRRARLWGPAGKKQVLHKLKLRQGSHLLSHKKAGSQKQTSGLKQIVWSQILFDNAQGEKEERA